MKLFVTNNIYFCSTKSAAWLQKKEIEELPKKSANFSKCTKSNPTQTSNYIRPKTIPRQELTCFQKLFACINTGYYCFLEGTSKPPVNAPILLQFCSKIAPILTPKIKSPISTLSTYGGVSWTHPKCVGQSVYHFQTFLGPLHPWFHVYSGDLLIVPKSAPILLQFCSKFAPIYTQKNKTQFNHYRHPYNVVYDL